MNGSPIFSTNLTNRINPSNLNYHMQCRLRKVKRSSNALQISSLAFGLRSAQKTKFSFLFPLSSFCFPFSFFLFPFSFFLFPFSSFLFPLSSFLFPLSSFHFANLSRKDQGDRASRVDYRSFSVLKTLTGSRPEISSSKCHKTWYRFLSPA